MSAYKSHVLLFHGHSHVLPRAFPDQTTRCFPLNLNQYIHSVSPGKVAMRCADCIPRWRKGIAARRAKCRGWQGGVKRVACPDAAATRHWSTPPRETTLATSCRSWKQTFEAISHR
ncbi:hypothetical protein BaRGS_00037376 [Batillaria attramentaria]|uniref:Uncharacterized protein n=1 Tax=Batillaria attramentaria TaxID=370345 RepID=A0ABD0J8X7_9CAEN